MTSAFGVGDLTKSQLPNGAYKAATALTDLERRNVKSSAQVRTLRMAKRPPEASSNSFVLPELDSAPSRPSTKVKNLHFGPTTQPHHAEQLERILAGRRLKRPVTAHVVPHVGRELGDGGITVTRPKQMSNHVILGGKVLDEEPDHAARIVHHEFTHANRTGQSQLNTTGRFGGSMQSPNAAHMREEARADHLSAQHSSAPTSYEQHRAGDDKDYTAAFSAYDAHRAHLSQVTKSAFGVDHQLAKAAPARADTPVPTGVKRPRRRPELPDSHTARNVAGLGLVAALGTTAVLTHHARPVTHPPIKRMTAEEIRRSMKKRGKR